MYIGLDEVYSRMERLNEFKEMDGEVMKRLLVKEIKFIINNTQY